MRAVVLPEPLSGEPPALTERPDPEPGPGEVLVRVHAAALNHRDLMWLDPESPFEPTPGFVMGADGAGEVAGLGAGVAGWSVGDRVLLDPLLTCGSCRACLADRVILCPRVSVLGGPADGTFADLVAVPARNVHRIPGHLSVEEAAALPMALGTAFNSLFAVGALRPAETVLIHGVGGGVAQVGVQLAAAAGATVIATSSDDAKLARARDLGAAHTINYRDTDVEEAVRDIVGPAGVDVVLDGVGGPTLLTSLRVVTPLGYGRVVRFGSAAGRRVDLPAALVGGKALLVGNMAAPREMAAAVAFLAGHRIAPLVDEPVPLEDVHLALKRLHEGRQNGKLVLRVG